MSTTLLNGLFLILAATSSLHLVDSSDNSDDSDDSGHDYSPATYPICGEKYQSPVDIKVQTTMFESKYTGLKFENYDSQPKLKLINKGHTVQVGLLGDIKSIGISGSGLSNKYYLEQFHFHWGTKDAIGSEHTIDGHAYPMEMHHVHFHGDYDNVSSAANQTGGLAVLGVFIEIGNENNTAFGKLISHFGQIQNEDDEVNITDTFSMDSLLPSNKADYYRYDGSLTTDPCYQSVNWTVFKDPIAISAYQMEEFRKLAATDKDMRNNFRPTKPLNERQIYRSYEEPETSTSYESTTAGAGIFPCSTFVLLYTAIFIYVAELIAI